MLPFSEACERNKLPILKIVRERFAGCRNVLEIGSGTGQHAVCFASAMRHLDWHPTERLSGLTDLGERVRLEGTANLKPPMLLDVTQPTWPGVGADAAFTANTLHIMSWDEVEALFNGLGTALAPGGVFCVYGPFRYAGRYTSASNESFDHMLRERDPASGLRDIHSVTALARTVSMRLDADYDLPAFNRLLVFIKDLSATGPM